MTTVTHAIRLSLTDNLVPAVVHAKQYDSMARKVQCQVYSGSAKLTLDSDTTVNVTGTRPDGQLFQYDSSADTDVVFIEDGNVCIWVTGVMTSAYGRMPVDVTITDGDSQFLGTFPFILAVHRAAVSGSALTTGSYSSLVEAVVAGFAEYILMRTDTLLSNRRTV